MTTKPENEMFTPEKIHDIMSKMDAYYCNQVVSHFSVVKVLVFCGKKPLKLSRVLGY